MKAKFPKSFFFIVGNEFAERFSYYGYRALLTPFLVLAFAMSREEASAVTHENIVLTYAMPVIGALLADWFLGKYRTILYVSVIYCIGHLLLAIYIDDLIGFRIGLIFIAMGAGMLKPNSSAMLGDQFAGKGARLTVAFNWYYFSINMGSFLAFLVIPELKVYGYEVAFAAPGVLMVIATAVLWIGKRSYIMVPPAGYPKQNFMNLNFRALKLKLQGNKEVWKKLETDFGKERVEGVRATWQVMYFFAFFPLVWVLYDMSSAEWILDAKELNREVFGLTLRQEQVQAFNPILILTMIPLMLMFMARMERKGKVVLARHKVLIGFICIGLATVVEGMIKIEIEAGAHPNVGWQLLAYFILTLGEVLISITGLEMGYRYSPPSMKSTITAVWYLTMSAGNLLAVWVNRAMINNASWSVLKEGANFYWFFLGLLVLNIIAFAIFVPHIKLKSYVED